MTCRVQLLCGGMCFWTSLVRKGGSVLVLCAAGALVQQDCCGKASFCRGREVAACLGTCFMLLYGKQLLCTFAGQLLPPPSTLSSGVQPLPKLVPLPAAAGPGALDKQAGSAGADMHPHAGAGLPARAGRSIQLGSLSPSLALAIQVRGRDATGSALNGHTLVRGTFVSPGNVRLFPSPLPGGMRCLVALTQLRHEPAVMPCSSS